ncbi:MAG: T9SS type A sorting domain-containing protein [Bacteroidota bacterium]
MSKNIYKVFVGLLMLGLFGSVQAQYSWTNLGPDNWGSVTRALVYDSQGNLLAGSQGGGLWSSADDGKSWTRVEAYDAAGGDPNITDILVVGSTVYVATGATEFAKPYARGVLKIDANTYDFRETPAGFTGNLDGLPGGGVWVLKGGVWSNDNATVNDFPTTNYQGPFVSIQSLAANGSRVFVGTREGLYYTDNDFETVQKAGGTPFFQDNFIVDIAVAAGNTVFAVVQQDNLTSGVDSLLISRNNGQSFSNVRSLDDPLIQDGNIQFGFEGATFAVAPSNDNIVYIAGTQASLEVNNVIRAEYNGSSWDYSTYAPRGGPGFSPLGNNGRDAFLMSVFPDNEDELILAGSNWYTFLKGQGWTQTAQHFNPTRNDYIPRNQYTVLFDPNNANKFFIGTSQGVVVSEDRGESFNLVNTGYESTNTYSVNSFKFQINGEEVENYESVWGNTGEHGVLYNRNFTSESAASQRFGRISTRSNYGDVVSSILYPGVLVSQGSDFGIVRSLNFGEAFDQFYGVSVIPQVEGLEIPATIDTLIDRVDDRSSGGNLNNNPTVAQAAWILDELVTEDMLNNEDLTLEEARTEGGSWIYFCSKNYVWVVNQAFGDALQVKWNRLTNELVDGRNEFLTAITVSGDENHTVYVGSNFGNIWRIENPNDLENFSAVDNVFQLNQPFVSFIDLNMAGRAITDLAIDPQNPDRLIVVFGGFGGNVGIVPSFVWATDSARDDNPGFGSLSDLGTNVHTQVIHSAEYVIEDGKSVLLLGGQKGLFSVRDIEVDDFIKGDVPAPYSWPIYTEPSWTAEFPETFGQVPVYDIFVRKYSATVNRSGLTRQIVEDGETKTVVRDGIIIDEDQTIFLATHGRGFWSSNSIAPGRNSNEAEEIIIEEADIRLYPNPASDFAQVEFDLTEKASVQIRVYSLDGRLVGQQQFALNAGRHQQSVDVRELVPGLYMVQVEAMGDTEQMNKAFKTVIE